MTKIGCATRPPRTRRGTFDVPCWEQMIIKQSMASALTHAVVGVALAQAGRREWRQRWIYWVLAVICSVLPDIDVAGFRLGIHYQDLWGHRGMTHSLLFA